MLRAGIAFYGIEHMGMIFSPIKFREKAGKNRGNIDTDSRRASILPSRYVGSARALGADFFFLAADLVPVFSP